MHDIPIPTTTTTTTTPTITKKKLKRRRRRRRSRCATGYVLARGYRNAMAVAGRRKKTLDYKQAMIASVRQTLHARRMRWTNSDLQFELGRRRRRRRRKKGEPIIGAFRRRVTWAQWAQ